VMGEIKFIGWDKVDKRMIQVYNICFNAGNSVYTDNTFVCVMGTDGVLYPKDRIILRQYTGLKDRNSIEAYHKDICKYKDYAGNNQIGVIEWADLSARFYIESVGGDDEGNQDGDLDREFEIIGNIHENPELLKG